MIEQEEEVTDRETFERNGSRKKSRRTTRTGRRRGGEKLFSCYTFSLRCCYWSSSPRIALRCRLILLDHVLTLSSFLSRCLSLQQLETEADVTLLSSDFSSVPFPSPLMTLVEHFAIHYPSCRRKKDTLSHLNSINLIDHCQRMVKERNQEREESNPSSLLII